jgi:hypothetical protein
MLKLTTNERPPTIVQLANAAAGPPVYMTKPKRTGMPETKFIEVNVAALEATVNQNWRRGWKTGRGREKGGETNQFSNNPKLRKNSCLYPRVARWYSSLLRIFFELASMDSV